MASLLSADTFSLTRITKTSSIDFTETMLILNGWESTVLNKVPLPIQLTPKVYSFLTFTYLDSSNNITLRMLATWKLSVL